MNDILPLIEVKRLLSRNLFAAAPDEVICA
jgi:hypothetical protein